MSSQVKLRHSPKQERAKQTVDRILRATKELIISKGMDALSTNKIAEAANVNIASLYQYFPNKDAIVAALIEDSIKGMSEVLDTELQAMMDLSIKEVSKRWLHTAIALYRESDGFLQEFVKSYNSTNPFPGAEILEQRLMETTRRFTMRRLDSVTVENLNTAIYVGFNAGLLVLSKHLLNPNSYLKDEEVVDGIAEMLSKYMEG